MNSNQYEIGMVGLGVMGRNLLLNMADHGYAVAGYDLDGDKVAELQAEAGTRDIQGAKTVADFVALLRSPRVVMMLVPAGNAVDAVIHDLLPYLAAGDLIIDAGNSHFSDTDLRQKTLANQGIHFFGMGVSGGEDGARHGPSMMPGGPRDVYERVRPVLEAAAARVDGDPCVAYMGPGSAGHYVKMVHNGIEYALMQLIAESYDLLHRGYGLTDAELSSVYAEWNQGELNSFLLEITSDIFLKRDAQTNQPLIDEVLDAAKQKGTGKWTSQDAMNLGTPTPTIDAAVAMRNLSALKEERTAASQLLTGPEIKPAVARAEFMTQLHNALHVTMIISYAQGMAQLQSASAAYGYHIDLSVVARIWRGGCIIRAALLEDIRRAYATQPDLPNLLLDQKFSQIVIEHTADLRSIVGAAAQMGIPTPGLMASLAYFDGYRSARLPANLIQAQRDDFGAHTYERIDQQGIFHTEWS